MAKQLWGGRQQAFRPQRCAALALAPRAAKHRGTDRSQTQERVSAEGGTKRERWGMVGVERFRKRKEGRVEAVNRGTWWHPSPQWQTECFEEHKQASPLNTKTFHRGNTATETQLQSLSFEAPAIYVGLSTACARVGLIRSRSNTRGGWGSGRRGAEETKRGKEGCLI